MGNPLSKADGMWARSCRAVMPFLSFKLWSDLSSSSKSKAVSAFMKLDIQKLYNIYDTHTHTHTLFKFENSIKREIVTKVLPYDSSAKDGQVIFPSLAVN
jgi:hypothetical protein